MKMRANVGTAPLEQDAALEGMDDTGGFGFRVIVAPATGKMRHLPPAHFHDGDEMVASGQAVALIEQGELEIPVVSPVAGRVAGVLVRDGEPVLKGQPIVWLYEQAGPRGAER
jgi:acetyl-CoA carboxylase biotin carboxyl carrier protein